MKKLYLDPDFEIVNIRLVSDVLTASTNVEEIVPTEGAEPSEGDWDNEDW